MSFTKLTIEQCELLSVFDKSTPPQKLYDIFGDALVYKLMTSVNGGRFVQATPSIHSLFALIVMGNQEYDYVYDLIDILLLSPQKAKVEKVINKLRKLYGNNHEKLNTVRHYIKIRNIVDN